MANETARARSGRVVLLVGTKKGVFLLGADARRESWSIEGPHFLGHIAYHVVLDPRDGRTMLLASKAGHLGPTLFRSSDLGKTWREVSGPPAFPMAAPGEKGRVVDHVFWLQPGAESESDVWYAGASPPALFRSPPTTRCGSFRRSQAADGTRGPRREVCEAPGAPGGTTPAGLIQLPGALDAAAPVAPRAPF